MITTLKTIPILGKHPLGYARLQRDKALRNLQFKRLYLMVRQDAPYKATLVMDLAINHKTKNPETAEDYEAYVEFRHKLSEMMLVNKNAYGYLHARWLSELGCQPDRLRVIYGKDHDFMDYNVRVLLSEKEKIMIEVK